MGSREKLGQTGIMQMELPLFTSNAPDITQITQDPRREAITKKEVPGCGHCGKPMTWKKIGTRGGRYVCTHCVESD